MPHWLKGCVLFLLAACSLAACIEREEGCLDIAARNFTADADDPCPDSCCVYPTWELTVRHRFRPADRPDTLVAFSYDSIYATSAFSSSLFQFDSVRFFLSDFTLEFANGTTAAVTDKLEITLADGTAESIRDDFLTAEPRLFNATEVGTIITSGTLTGVRFLLGLTENLRTADLESFPTGNPLDLPADAYNHAEGDGFLPLRMRLVAPPGATDTLDVRVLEPISVVLTLDAPFVLEPGFDLGMTLTVDYAAWLGDVNVATATEAEVMQAIRDGAANSFAVIAVEN